VISLQQCLVCGEQFSPDLKFCLGCGADYKSIETIESEEIAEKSIPVEIPVLKTKNKIDGKPELKFKSVSVIKLIYFGIFLFFAGALIVYSSGIFDSPATVSANVSSADPHAGVDLANLREVNRLEEIIKNNPGDYKSLLNLAHLLNDSGLKEKAIEKYLEYIKSNPNSPDVLVDLGVCYYELNKNENAILYMEKAIKVEPKHQIAHLDLGIVNFSLGNKEKAKECWTKAIVIDPTNEIAKRAKELINQH
jgi:tetratricopeptide (TPR) repeat protein